MRAKTPNDQTALDAARAHLASVGALQADTSRSPLADGALAHLTRDQRRAIVAARPEQRAALIAEFTNDPGDAA